MSLKDLLNNTQKSSPLTKVVPTSTVSSGGLENLVNKATPVNLQAREYQREANVAQQEATQANKFGTILKETAKGTVKSLYEPIKEAAVSTYKTFEATPGKIQEDIQAASEDIEKGNVLKGVVKAGGRVAGDTAEAIFAPISGAVGALMKITGGQKLTDAVGQVVADKSGITDWPAFQKFAMEHPNAGEDFNRILTLVMSKLETGEINPARMATEATNFARKIVGSAKVPSASEGLTGLNKLAYESKPLVEVPSTKVLNDINLGTKENLRLDTDVKLQQAKQFKIIPDDATPDTKVSVYPVEGKPGHVSFEPSALEKPIQVPLRDLVKSEGPGGEYVVFPKIDTKVSKLAIDIEKNAIKNDLTKGFKDLTEYNPTTVEYQARRIAEEIQDMPRVEKYISGELELPQDIKSSAFVKTLARQATESGNVELLQKLASSKLLAETSEAASTLRLAQENGAGVNDPLTLIKDVQKVREESVLRRTKNKDVNAAKEQVVKEIKTNIKRPATGDWNSFIDSITC